jgi:hypothetical protein
LGFYLTKAPEQVKKNCSKEEDLSGILISKAFLSIKINRVL